MISQNLENVFKKIENSALRSNRDPQEIKLIAVTKKVSIHNILECIKAGVNIIGENYVQEALSKIEKLPSHIEWHMIGHLQRNKVKYIIESCSMIQSVDSIELAEEISKRGKQINKIMPILIEVNQGEELTKTGVKNKDDIIKLVQHILTLPNLSLKGLMSIPPFFINPEDVRPFFRQLRELKDEINKIIPKANLTELSMGMSNDFEIAIEEGATMVRIGRAIFGERI